MFLDRAETSNNELSVKLGVMNGPWKFLTARKILPLLDMLAKFKRVLAYSCSPNFCVARKLAKQIFLFLLVLAKKIAVLGMLANARKDHSSPLKFKGHGEQHFR